MIKIPIGTKTLLYGNHQFLLHPLFVGLAWTKYYHKLPNPKEAICIIIHDWGYWGKPNLDGEEGEQHPFWAAQWALNHFDKSKSPPLYNKSCYYLCLYHSSFLSKRLGIKVSRLCIPDKLGVIMMPIWLIVLLGKLTGETNEYRNCPKYAHNHRENMTDTELYRKFREYYLTKIIPNLKED
jgi:hypothetical protein